MEISMIVLIMLMNVKISEELTGCEGTNGFFRCGIDSSYSQCYEYNDGSFLNCDNSWPGPAYTQYQLPNNAGTYNTGRCGYWCCVCGCCDN